MTTESSAVSNLIRLSQTRRLKTDPADEFLFQPPAGARAPVQRTVPRLPGLVPSFAPDTRELSTTARVSRPEAPRRSRSWFVPMSMAIAAALGIAIPAYLDHRSTEEPTIEHPSAPITMQTVVTAPPAVVSPQQAPPVVAPPPSEAPAPPPAEAAAAAPTVATAAEPQAPIASPPTETRHAKKSIAKKKAHVALAKKAAPASAAPPPPTAPQPAAAPAVSNHAGPQSDDNENPLH
jgi:hypothetical protein